jgi:ABC-type nickel/cobalt efflux system permease component RcnA
VRRVRAALIFRAMLEAIALLGSGFLLGMLHAGDPDHVVAVTTIVSDQRSVRRAGAIGALWGIGHTVPLLVLGGAIVALRMAVPPRLALALEFGVALMLIALGVANILRHPHRRAHRHQHDGTRRTPGGMRPLVVGFVHGLAGTAAVALYVLTRVDSPLLAMTSLVLFGLGTVAGMMLITALVGVPASFAAARFPGAAPWLRVASGVVSLGFGLLLAHRIGIEDGLFVASAIGPR